MSDPLAAILAAARSSAVEAPTAELGYERIRALTGTSFNDAALADAVAAAVRDSLLRDPVRLEPGALQCRWVLELTPKGVEAIGASTGHSRARGCEPAKTSYLRKQVSRDAGRTSCEHFSTDPQA